MPLVSILRNVEDVAIIATVMAPLELCFRFEIKVGFGFSFLMRTSLGLVQAVVDARNSAEFQEHPLFLPVFVTQI